MRYFFLAVCSAIALVFAVPFTSGVARAETSINVGVVSRTVFYLPIWMAEKRGFFKDEGIDVKIKVYDSSDPIFVDVRKGEQQVAFASIESVVAEAYKGGKMRIVAGSAKRPPHFIIAQPEIKTLADLKGKLIGVVSMHEGTTFFISDIAKAGGFSVKDVKVEAVGGSPARQKLLLARKIDAGLQPYPLSYEAEAAGLTNLGPIANLVPDYQFTSVMVDDDWAKANRKAMVGFLRALRRGTDYMFANPDETADVAVKELHTTKVNALRAIQDTQNMDIISRDLSVTPESIKRVFENMQQDAAIGRDLTLDVTRFVDDSYLKESLR